MTYRVKLRAQVREFIESRAPESRTKLKTVLRGLEKGEGDDRALREALSGFYRTRVGSYGILYRYMPGRMIECVFAGERSMVYQLFARELMDRLRNQAE
jgi:mRNA-degrading endonuclease RelE of RelBE toxin-antitoxin system